MLLTHHLVKLLQPISRLAVKSNPFAPSDACFSTEHGFAQKLPCHGVRKRDTLPTGAHFLWCAPLAAVVATSSSESDDEDKEEDPREVVIPKGKFLWCQDDSYGYTRGTGLCFRDSITNHILYTLHDSPRHLLKYLYSLDPNHSTGTSQD
jgi:hypothetical protein